MGLFRVRVVLLAGLVFVSYLLTLQLASAQAPSGSDEKKLAPRTPESAENALQTQRHIGLDVVVTDSAGKSVSGLQQQDFTILDNNQPQKMTSFDAVQGPTADPPVEIVLLIDLV